MTIPTPAHSRKTEPRKARHLHIREGMFSAEHCRRATSRNARGLLDLIWFWANGSRELKVSVSALAAHFAVPRQRVRRWLDQIINDGYLEGDVENGRATTFRIVKAKTWGRSTCTPAYLYENVQVHQRTGTCTKTYGYLYEYVQAAIRNARGRDQRSEIQKTDDVECTETAKSTATDAAVVAGLKNGQPTNGYHPRPEDVADPPFGPGPPQGHPEFRLERMPTDDPCDSEDWQRIEHAIVHGGWCPQFHGSRERKIKSECYALYRADPRPDLWWSWLNTDIGMDGEPIQRKPGYFAKVIVANIGNGEFREPVEPPKPRPKVATDPDAEWERAWRRDANA